MYVMHCDLVSAMIYNITPRRGCSPEVYHVTFRVCLGLFRVCFGFVHRFFQGLLWVLCQIQVLDGFRVWDAGLVVQGFVFWKQISSAIWAI